jgi:small subunit ribosomal protein S14e
MLITLK